MRLDARLWEQLFDGGALELRSQAQCGQRFAPPVTLVEHAHAGVVDQSRVELARDGVREIGPAKSQVRPRLLRRPLDRSADVERELVADVVEAGQEPTE